MGRMRVMRRKFPAKLLLILIQLGLVQDKVRWRSLCEARIASRIFSKASSSVSKSRNTSW